ncbi:MAG: ABC transporter permease, partial [Lachnospiraceae bacterium]|nr:ABC transporter permease [Lachnospiraceae bacterium]
GLYRGQRCLWVSQTIFRMRTNYRTYAMVCIMGICSVTALATGFAMRNRYDNMIAFNHQYTFQFISNQSDIANTTQTLLDEKSAITYQSALCALCPDSAQLLSSYSDVQQMHLMLSYSDIQRVAQEAGMTFAFCEPADDEVYYLSHLVLLSFITNEEAEPVTIAGKTYRQTQRIMTPYLGYMQKELGCFYVVSDREYERLKAKSETVYYICNYKIADNDVFWEARAAFDTIVSNTDENYTARVSIDPYSNEGEWIKALHSLCIFMFLVFIVAGGCIMFMKLYNDSFEETERYAVLKKLGFSTRTLSASIAHELVAAYLLPFVVMTVSAYFSVLALGKMMRADLFAIYVVSTAVVFIVFVLFCVLSIVVYQKTLSVTVQTST